ncbi:hypothetical protein CSA37_10975 [Candidatus Fermentibacteria bacterium]|nr:MAG: hypothetical protein CSA37_10975 [Candidatus Fermentibacteria bacterium]
MPSSPFRILNRKKLDAVRSTVTLAEHKATGAVLVHLDSPEERENFFSICFRTPPADNRGTPHILEHTVLCGSKKYPVKDPFMELVRSSMATFINAMTYDDRTVYPVGSTDRRDFLNLVDVYMDAVFHPLLRKEFFLQEGFRLQINHDGTLTGSGVVYNEMKGAYADPDSYMERETSRILFPDSPYGKDSGGDPPSIETLTFGEYRKFYKDHYHPGNSCLFALTSIPFQEFAERMDTLLPEKGENAAKVTIEKQKKFSEPVKREIPVQGENGGCTVLSAWMVNDAGNPCESLAFSLLEDVLLDEDSSPVKKTLLDSGLGTGLSSCGYDADSLQRTFVIGLKGVKRTDAEKVLDLIHTTLRELAEKGPDWKLVQGMLHRKELLLRYSGSGWPFALMSLVNSAWAHRQSIMRALDLNALMAELRENLSEDFLSGMISKWLVKNPHRADIIFKPDSKMQAREERDAQKRMTACKNSLSAEQLEELAREEEKLEEMLDAPDAPEALAAVPRLSLSEIEVSAPKLFHKSTKTPDGMLLNTEMSTTGLVYVDLCMDLSGLNANLFPYLPLFTAVLTRTGAGNLSHLEMADLELKYSSGLSASVNSVTSSYHSTDKCLPLLKISGYCLESHLSRMLELMKLRLFNGNLRNTERISSILRETEERLRSSLIPGGDAFASLRVRAGLTAGHMLSELFSGIPAVKRFANPEPEKEIEAFIQIAAYIRERAPRTLAWTGQNRHIDMLFSWLEKNAAVLPAKTVPDMQPSYISKQGIMIQADTSFAAAAMTGLPLKHHLALPGIVAVRMLSEGYLWDEIRSKNGAYGAGASMSGGALTFSSYRDPAPAETLRCFRNTVKDCATRLDLRRQSINDSIKASLKGLDPPLRPAGANGMAILRHFSGLDRKLAEEVLHGLLGVNREQIECFADWIASSEHTMQQCIMGNSDVMKRAEITEIINGGL